MKIKTDRKALQAKLNRSITTFVKSIGTTNSKKISKSIKRASKIVAKAVAKEIDEKVI